MNAFLLVFRESSRRLSSHIYNCIFCRAFYKACKASTFELIIIITEARVSCNRVYTSKHRWRKHERSVQNCLGIVRACGPTSYNKRTARTVSGRNYVREFNDFEWTSPSDNDDFVVIMSYIINTGVIVVRGTSSASLVVVLIQKFSAPPVYSGFGG